MYNQVVFDGSDPITGWVAEGTANVWQATVSHTTGANTGRLRVWNTANELLTRVPDVATCSSTPGSYVELTALSGTPWTVKVHPSTGDANPEGYFVTRRNYGLFADGTGSVVSDVITKRSTANNGSFEMGLDATADRVLCLDGSKHNSLIKSGIFRDVIGCRWDNPISIETAATVFVAFVGDAAGYSYAFERCFCVAEGSINSISPMIAHDSTGNQYTSGTLRQCGTVGMSSSWAPSAAAVTVEGYHAVDVVAPMAGYSDTYVNRYGAWKFAVDSIGASFQKGSPSGPWSRLVQDAYFYHPGSLNALFRAQSVWDGVTFELRNCVINFTAFAGLFASEGMSSGTIKVNNCLIVANGVLANAIIIPSGVTYEGNNNVFAGTNLYNKYQGNSATLSLATWQSQTGQDANSIKLTDAECATIFSGTVANGDFRLNSTGSGATIAAMGAGPQYYWNWNTRAATAGQMSAWPVMPTNEAECITYISDPEAWNFYP